MTKCLHDKIQVLTLYYSTELMLGVELHSNSKYLSKVNCLHIIFYYILLNATILK